MSLISVRHSLPAPPGARTGIVLSGGGARGAYQVGVVRGILDVLGSTGNETTPFSVLCGTSVGAINAAYFAAHAEAGAISRSTASSRRGALSVSTRITSASISAACSGSTGRRGTTVKDGLTERPIEARALLDSLPLTISSTPVSLRSASSERRTRASCMRSSSRRWRWARVERRCSSRRARTLGSPGRPIRVATRDGSASS